MNITVILGVSIVLQLIAVIVAVSLARTTGVRRAWFAIAGALLLTAIPRSITFVRMVTGEIASPPNLEAELVALEVSFLMGIGLAWIGQLFRSIQKSRDELLKSQKTLGESENRLKILFEYAPDAIYMFDLNSLIIDMNRAAEELTGYSRCELVGKHLRETEILVQSDVERLAESFARNVADEATAPEEYVLNRKDGTLVTMEIRAYLVQIGEERIVLGIGRDTTERKRAEEILRATKEQYRLLVENQTDLVVKMDADGRLLFVSPSYCEMFGKTEKQLLGTNFMPTVHDDDREMTTRAMQDLYEPPYRCYIEQRALTKDGWRWLAWADKSVLNDTDEVVAIVGVGRDITQRKRAEEALHESERRFTDLFKELPIGIYRTTPDGRILNANPALIRMLGYSSFEELVSHNIEEKGFLPQYPRSHFKELIERDGEVKGMESKWTTRDKSTILVWENARAVRGAEGAVLYYEGTVENITERKRAEEALRIRNWAIESSIDAIALADLEGNLTFVNKSFVTMWGYEQAKEILGKPAVSLWQDEEKAAEVFHRLKENDSWTGELVAKRKDDSHFPVMLSTSMVRNEAGSPISLMASFQDLTERMRTEEEKQKLEAQVRRTQKLETIGTLAGGIAHDFNNILTPILGFADMASNDVDSDSEVRENLEHVIKAAYRAKDLVQQILIFSRQAEQERKPVLIHLVIKEALKLVRASLPTTIEIRDKIDSKCGAVLADPSQMHQVLMNLCTNAYHAMREEGGVLEVSLSPVEVDADFVRVHPNLHEGPYVRLTVTDTGKGMDRATLERIFEPFFTTKEIGDGTGLGLSVVHGIVMNHSGEITVYSEPGKGTMFHVYLPRAESAVAKESTTLQPIPRGNEHVLFVDDEDEIAIMGKQMLERLGYRVTTRTSSVEALEAFRADPDRFDIVITDQTMPQMTGSRLAKELTSIKPNIPIVLISGFSETSTAESREKVGIREVIMKPLVARDLSFAIRKALERQTKVSA
jgi:PAS domain S-box-containing protein